MKLRWTSHFTRSYSKAPEDIQTAFGKQSLLLLQNLRHPSLRANKYDEGKDRWLARVTQDWRFYFVIQGDAYILQEKRIARFRSQEMPAELDAGEQKNGKRQGGFRGPEGAVSKALAADGQ